MIDHEIESLEIADVDSAIPDRNFARSRVVGDAKAAGMILASTSAPSQHCIEFQEMKCLIDRAASDLEAKASVTR
jgi:hypothetical protein